ncbi:MAG: ribosome biogenesis/translation initiation ATPase RLI [Candidatus Diapherotrites archaeon]
MASVKQQEDKPRLAVIDFDKCSPESCGNFLCVRICPVNRQGKECIIIDLDKNRPVISEILCTACKICSNKCPRKAISIINLVAELRQPLHQYGKNQFRIYRMPYPKKGHVVGLIGKNGTGKSTLLKIVSGNLIPNLGNYKEKPSFDKVIEEFAGRELGLFFSELKEKEIRISFKPQNIDELPKITKGKVIDLLKKSNEKGNLEELINALDLNKILERNLNELSGGELQRLSIAAAAGKKAGIYAFDEPSSFLDVSQRLRAAQLISSLADESTSVIVIEHDLALLDYLSDLIHVIFGSPGAYGVVSSPKSTRNGLNEFLDGFLRDENLRFRNEELKFSVRPALSEGKKIKLIDYCAFSKSFGKGFSMKVNAGSINSAEVIGVLGPNAIGKTTFVKILAGAEKADQGDVGLGLKVSYKPQYLDAEKGITVQELLLQNKYSKELFKTQVDRRLNVSDLFEKELIHLSGGELQKVAVALALCRPDYDLLLLDEPSAFVDAEDRVQMAEAIRSVIDSQFKTAFVVDHDLLFIDFVSDKLMVFEGEPAVKGTAHAPVSMHEGMNAFLKQMEISMRRDSLSGRPRINKSGSVLDREQKENGEYYYKVN